MLTIYFKVSLHSAEYNQYWDIFASYLLLEKTSSVFYQSILNLKPKAHIQHYSFGGASGSVLDQEP